ncbi:30S ribosomal protein S5 [Bacilli bacterium]|nr:30S ribosomal protein S5 [Bacilli bacterium]
MGEIKTAAQLDTIADKEANALDKEVVLDSANKPTGGFKSNFRNNNRRNGPQMSKSGYEEKVIQIKRINKTTKGGRRMRFSALVVIGDKKGKIGYGIGKSIEVPVAIKKALKNAESNIVNVIINKNGTIYHDVNAKICASKVLLKPARVGTGLIAGGSIRTVVELAGYKDIYTKNMGASTTINMVQATINALKSQNHPSVIAELRGKNIKEL